MSWNYVIFVAGLLVCLGAGTIFLLLANRRQKLECERRTRYFQSVPEIASQSVFSSGWVLIAVANFNILRSLSRPQADFTLPVLSILILTLILGVQLGRLLIRCQLRRLGALLNTVTGEITSDA